MDVGELFGDVRDEGRLIAFATVGDRRKVRTVGLDEHAIQRRLFGDLPQHRRVVERQNSGKGKIEPQIQRILRQPGISRKAVEDPADF